MVDSDRIELDEERILELIVEFDQAETRQERREIESKVLSETVWKAPELGHSEIIIARHELENLLQNLTDAVERGDEQMISMYHRKPSFLVAEKNRTI